MSTPGRLLAAALAATGLGAVLLIGLPRTSPAPPPGQEATVERVLSERFGPAPETHAGAVDALVLLGSAAIPDLVRLWLGDGDALYERVLDREDVWIGAGGRLSEVAAGTLARLPAEDVLVHLAARAEAAPTIEQKVAMVRLVGRLESARGLPLLFRLADRLGPLAHRYRSVGTSLEGSLVRILEADPEAPAALESLVAESGGRLISPVIAAAEKAATPRGMLLLVAFLEDERAPKPEVIRAIGTLGVRYAWCLDGFPLFHLRPYLSDSRVDVRRAATVALGELREAESVEDLLGLLDDGDPLVRRAAERALCRFSGLLGKRDEAAWQGWSEREDDWYRERFELECASVANGEPTQIVRALRELGAHPLYRHEAAREIAVALPGFEPELLAEACRTLVALDSRHAVPGLFAVLESGSDDLEQAVLPSLIALTGFELGGDPDAWRGRIEG